MKNQVRATGFGPGKVILLGEHGVVYGHPALAAPLRLGVEAEAIRAPAKDATVEVPRRLGGAASRRLLTDAFAAAVRASGVSGLRVRLESELPPSMGLGSSAAVSVACARALLTSRDGVAPALSEVMRVAFEMEKVFHGTPSGVDHTTSAMGQVIRFQRAPGSADAQVAPVRPKRPLGLVVALVGARPATKATVAALRARRERWPTRYARVFEEIGELVEEGRAAAERGDLELLGDLMNMNQGMLGALGLSSARIEATVYRLRAAGALGAKLTGAGGDGGAVLGLFEAPEKAVAKLRRAGVKCFSSRVAGGGR